MSTTKFLEARTQCFSNSMLNYVQGIIVSSTFIQIWPKTWSFIWAATKWIGVKAVSALAATSTDGSTWTSHTLPSTQSWSCLASIGTVHAALAKGSTSATSSIDGITWTARTLPNARAWTSLAASATTFVGVAFNSAFCVTSTDGITWTEHAMPLGNWTSIAYNGTTTFAAVSETGIAASSTDNGATWTLRTPPLALKYSCITWHMGQFTAVATGPTPYATYSTDGITWGSITLPVSDNWTAIGPGVTNA